MNKAIDKLLGIMAFFAGVLLLFVTFSISYTIFSRITGLSSPLWVLQCNEYALLWITFLGTAWVLKRDKHVSIDLVTGRLSPKKQSWFRLFHSLLGMLLCLVFLWYGTRVTIEQFQRGVVDVQAVDVPKYIILMVIPIGFFALVLQFARQFFTTADRLRRTPENDFSMDQGS
ncbi:MAG: TRAP transporter small permease [Desulfotignum sp.]|nr:TRAP transporter small permease [Desulfotignum sp.]